MTGGHPAPAPPNVPDLEELAPPPRGCAPQMRFSHPVNSAQRFCDRPEPPAARERRPYDRDASWRRDDSRYGPPAERGAHRWWVGLDSRPHDILVRVNTTTAAHGRALAPCRVINNDRGRGRGRASVPRASRKHGRSCRNVARRGASPNKGTAPRGRKVSVRPGGMISSCGRATAGHAREYNDSKTEPGAFCRSGFLPLSAASRPLLRAIDVLTGKGRLGRFLSCCWLRRNARRKPSFEPSDVLALTRPGRRRQEPGRTELRPGRSPRGFQVAWDRGREKEKRRAGGRRGWPRRVRRVRGTAFFFSTGEGTARSLPAVRPRGPLRAPSLVQVPRRPGPASFGELRNAPRAPGPRSSVGPARCVSPGHDQLQAGREPLSGF